MKDEKFHDLHNGLDYRGSPPCTLSQNPDEKEIGYSNVLGTLKLSLLHHCHCQCNAVEMIIWKICC